MIEKLKPKSEFTKNVFTLMIGTSISQAIPIAISPILTRLYTPKDFGVFALFIAITSILGNIANGRYELAIMLPKKDEDAINILALGFIINISLTLFLFLIVIIFHGNILKLLNNKDISPWLYLVPVSVFLMGCFNLLSYFNNRKKFYKDLAKANVYKSIGAVIVQLILGVLRAGAGGLISGNLVSQVISNTKLLLNIKKMNLFGKVRKIEVIALGKRYIDFPKFSSVATILNSLSNQLINILISSLFNIKTLGLYSLTQRILGMPLSFVGRSISQVYFEEASREKRTKGVAISVFKSTVKRLSIISFVLFGILFFSVESLFSIVFGKEWAVAGMYAKILIPLYFFRFISSNVSLTTSVFEKQRSSLIINASLAITALATIFIAKLFSLEFKVFLEIFSITMSLNYLIFLLYYFRLAKGEV